MHNFEQDLKELKEEKRRLATEFSKARNKLCDELQITIGSILAEFEKETGFVASEINVEISKIYFVGQLKPEYSFRNVYAKLDVEENL